jgi:competence protein ComEA
VPVSDQTQQPGLVVDVAGKVRRPGIVELPAGSRVIDALTAAGGPRPGVDTAGLNLARPLVDGEQIVVGLDVPAAPPVGGPPTTAGATAGATAVPASVDINTADQTELETLPGIGPVTAQSILAWRSENGLFASVEQLLDVSGIGEATLADIEPYVHV